MFAFIFRDEWELGVLRSLFSLDLIDPGIFILRFVIDVKVRCLSQRGVLLGSVGESFSEWISPGLVPDYFTVLSGLLWISLLDVISSSCSFSSGLLLLCCLFPFPFVGHLDVDFIDEFLNGGDRVC